MKILLILFFTGVVGEIYSQPDNFQNASGDFCGCIHQINTDLTDNDSLISLFKNCLTITIENYKNLITNTENVIKLFEGGSSDCYKEINYFNKLIAKSKIDSNLVYRPTIDSIDCKNKLLYSKYIQVDPAFSEIYFKEKELFQTITSSNYYCTSNILWNGPCSYSLTLKETNMEVIRNNFTDTIFVDILYFTNDSLMTRSTMNGTTTINKYKRTY